MGQKTCPGVVSCGVGPVRRSLVRSRMIETRNNGKTKTADKSGKNAPKSSLSPLFAPLFALCSFHDLKRHSWTIARFLKEF